MMHKSKAYDVALSYAGEDRESAGDLVQRLLVAGYTCFYDEHERDVLWGASLVEKLQRVYEHDSRYCVIIVSRHYVRKAWTNLERRFALARAVREDTPYVLPIKVDDAELPGLPGDTVYVDLRQIGMDQVVALLTKKLGPVPGARKRGTSSKTAGLPVQLYPRNLLGLVVCEAEPLVPAFNIDCLLLSLSDVPRSITRLEASVTAPGGVPLQFAWNLFYDYVPSSNRDLKVMVKTDDANEFQLDGMGRRFLGVQFTGPRLKPKDVWVPGQYEFELYGWVDQRQRHEKVDCRTKFKVRIGQSEAADIAHWSDAPRSAWDQLNDSDRAVAIPVYVDERSIAAI